MSLSGLAEESAEKQVQALTLCFSRETLTIVQNFGLTDEEKKSVTAITCAIKRHIDGHINESVERRNLDVELSKQENHLTTSSCPYENWSNPVTFAQTRAYKRT